MRTQHMDTTQNLHSKHEETTTAIGRTTHWIESHRNDTCNVRYADHQAGWFALLITSPKENVPHREQVHSERTRQMFQIDLCM